MNICLQFVDSYVSGVIDEISGGLFRIRGYDDVWYTGHGIYEVNGVFLFQ
ncbi:hypothetical protein EOVG_00307 [Emiliania huxleyi virus 88]|nr:hypothetical protein EOVG_00307 [Emiliania huxleyi virus 88]AEP15861.1 hypothetical protein EQVG_00453 [Emiliania huxleyi virus 207]AEP16313.1 hypothetical protein ERVG_00440 [Emiliania huxleyi virus 208]